MTAKALILIQDRLKELCLSGVDYTLAGSSCAALNLQVKVLCIKVIRLYCESFVIFLLCRAALNQLQ